MKLWKVLALPVATAMVALGIVSTAPVNAVPEHAASASVLDSQEMVDGVGDVDSSNLADSANAKTGWKLGVYPAPATICVANGLGGDTASILTRWNQASYGALALSIRNVCTGYSITNRMTITHYSAAGTGCAKFTNTHRVWDSRQQAYVYDQNVVVWINTSDYCSGGDPPREHRIAMFIGYILGVKYVNCPSTCQYVMGYTPWPLNNVPFVTTNDRRLMAAVYGLTA